MISQFAHEYIHSNSIKKLSICQEIIQKTENLLEPIYNAKHIMVYELLIIKSSVDAQDELLEGSLLGCCAQNTTLIIGVPLKNLGVAITLRSVRDGDRLITKPK